MSNAKSSSRGPTLSVGIPTLNQASFLPETLDSLLTQSRPPDEILVSDHYSTDNTQQVLADYQARYPGRIRVLQPPPGSNLTAQYNFTLSSLTGDWITLLSSDDLARPTFCEVLLRGAARKSSADPDPVLVRAGWEHIDADAQVRSTNYLLSVPATQGPPDTLTAQKYGPQVNFAAFAIRREAFLQSGPILESLESLSDWALFLQMTPFGPYVYEHALISGYRVNHDGDKFRDRLPMWTRDMQRIFGEVIPLAATRCGMTDLGWIEAASLYNYTRYLAKASREFTPNSEARQPVAALFQPWANTFSPQHSTAAHTALRAFSAGEITRTSLSLSRRTKNLLRPVFQRFHTLLRRR